MQHYALCPSVRPSVTSRSCVKMIKHHTSNATWRLGTV